MNSDTASILISLIDCLEGGGPFMGLWDQTSEHLQEMGYSEDEIEKAIKELYDIAGMSR
jgi:hypothetical protein